MAEHEIDEIDIFDNPDNEKVDLIGPHNQITTQIRWTKSTPNTILHGWGDRSSPPPEGEVGNPNRYNQITYQYLANEQRSRNTDWVDRYFQSNRLYKDSCWLVSIIVVLYLIFLGYVLYQDNVKDINGQRENSTYVTKSNGSVT